MDKLKILISAYAFHPKVLTFTGPDRGILAWNLVDRLKRFYDLWVITHSKNRDDVLEALSAGALPKVNIHFINLPRCWRPLQKTSFGRRFCLFLWQRKAWKYARALHSEIHFDAVHHLTPEFDWIPSFIGAYLPIPFIWGPLGGGERIPRGLLSEYSVYERWREKWRLLGQWFGREYYARREGEKNAQSILVCNQETRMMFPKTDVRKIHFFPLSGVDSDPIKPDPKKARNQDIFRIITAGYLHKNNGFRLSIEAYALFSNRFPESDFVIFGEGPEQKTLERLIDDQKLESRVRIHPWIERKALHERMQDSDVFLSSAFLDRSGFFVVLAMSARLPVS
jgi:glycosyltransferase involved in cell wall biosynthesis